MAEISAVEYQDILNHINYIYVFVLKNSGLCMNRMRDIGRMTHWEYQDKWKWAPKSALYDSGIRSVASIAPSATGRLYVFFIGNDYHLHTYHWDGVEWKHEDRGMPSPDFPITSGPGVTYYLRPYGDGEMPDEKYLRINVFVVAADSSLWTCHWDGTNWQWKHVNNPPEGYLSTEYSITPGAISYYDRLLIPRTYVFVPGGGSNNLLNRCYWNGQSAQWLHECQIPPYELPVSNKDSASAIAYKDGRIQNIRAFVMQDRLRECNWNGSHWRWYDWGTPEGVPDNSDNKWGNPPVAISFQDKTQKAPEQRIFAFSIKNKGNQHLYYWDNLTKQWNDPAKDGPKLFDVPSVIRFKPTPRFPAPLSIAEHIIAFALGADDVHLHMYDWDGKRWWHEDLGTPCPTA